MNTLAKAAISIALGVLAVIALAPLIGFRIPESIWGMSIGSFVGLVGTLIPAGKEKFQLEVPVNYRVKMSIEVVQER